MEPLALVDGSNFWYRAYSQATTIGLDTPGSAVLIMSNMLKKFINQFGKNNLILCWDKGRSGRDQISTEYKANRISAEGVWEELIYLQLMIKALGIKEAFQEGYEADDVIGTLAKNHQTDAYIISGDKDFYQLVNNEIKIFRPGRKVRKTQIPDKIIDESAVLGEFGCKPEKLILYKSFKGDSSDNIPKLPIRFTKKFKEPFFSVIEKASSVNEFYEYIGTFDKKYHEDLHNFKDQALINEKLVTIKIDCDNVIVLNNKMDLKLAKKLCDEMEITRLNLDTWRNLPASAVPPPEIQGELF